VRDCTLDRDLYCPTERGSPWTGWTRGRGAVYHASLGGGVLSPPPPRPLALEFLRDMSLLGLDIGTTGSKAVAFREDGEKLASAYREYDLVSPRPGQLELDPRRVLAAIREVIGEVASKTRGDPIRSFGACTLGEAAVPVDEAHRPVANAIVGFESRGKEEMDELARRMGADRLFEIAGHGFNSSHTLFKILWLKKHSPDVFARTRKFLCFADFTAASMGLPPRTDHSIAARTLAFDIHRLDWSDEILSTAGLSRDLFAPPIAPGERVGEIRDDSFGLPKGCVIAGGLHDQPAGILGSGVRPGESMLATGTVICLGVRLTTRPATQVMVDNNLCYYPGFGRGQKISIAYSFTGGSLLKWYRDSLAGEELRVAAEQGVDPYEIICSGLPDEPTDLLVLPHFSMTGTPWLDPRALGSIHGLRLTTTRKEIVKALLEGILFEIRLNTELLAHAGIVIDRYRAIGGAARSRVWMQIAADILDRPIVILEIDEAASLGAAVLGARAAGILPSDEAAYELIARRAGVRDVIEPRSRHAALYAERYAIYKDLYPTTKEISHRLFALSQSRRG
jgi:xylulokinase